MSLPRSIGEHLPRGSAAAASRIWSVLAGLLIPVTIWLIGGLAHQLDGVPGNGRDIWPRLTPTQLVGLIALASVAFGLAFYLTRRDADWRVRRFASGVRRAILGRSIHRVETLGAITQRDQVQRLLSDSLPAISRWTSLWYRVVPRSVLMLAGCLLLAILIDPWLTLLAIGFGAAIGWLQRRVLDPTARQRLDREIAEGRDRLVGVINRAAVLDRSIGDRRAAGAFDSVSAGLDAAIARRDRSSAFAFPVLWIAVSVAASVLLLGFVTNSQIAAEDSNVRRGDGLTLGDVVTLTLAIAGAVVSGTRLLNLVARRRRIARVLDHVERYLDDPSTSTLTPRQLALPRVEGGRRLRDGISMRSVDLKTYGGDAVLAGVSLDLRPGSLVAVIGSDAVSPRSLVELMMGFGKPASGEALVDGVAIDSIDRRSLAAAVMWVDASGPRWEGTIAENLQSAGGGPVDSREMIAVLNQLGIYERIVATPQGLETHLDAESATGSGDADDALTSLFYPIGIARACLAAPPVVLVDEPPAGDQTAGVHDRCLSVLRGLAAGGSLVVMLPRRLPTLRSADRVILLDGPKFSGEGRHADLLTSSDLYRHINYLLFNPYRRVGG